MTQYGDETPFSAGQLRTPVSVEQQLHVAGQQVTTLATAFLGYKLFVWSTDSNPGPRTRRLTNIVCSIILAAMIGFAALVIGVMIFSN